MEEATRVCGTDEDELIDVEGDVTSDVITKNGCAVAQKLESNVIAMNPNPAKHPGKRKQCDTECPTPFKKLTTVRYDATGHDSELAKWWSQVSDTTISKKASDVTEQQEPEQDEFPSVTLDPILQPLPRGMVKNSSDMNTSAKAPTETYYTECGEEFYPPEEEIQLHTDMVTEAEKDAFPEYFNGKTKYTVEKYLSIRNAILDLWKQMKPEHVYKVALRPVLKKACGNVNNVGRIHRHLESIGAINFRSENVWWKRKKTKKKKLELKDLLGTDEKLKRALEQRMSGRSRKKPTQFTSDPTEDTSIGGYTIDHANNDAIVLPEPPPKVTKSSPNKTAMKQYDLIQCRKYELHEDCPYEVTIDASSLVIMDIHSHLSKHEVMGLLGGHVHFAEDGRGRVKVHIVSTQPCRSTGSTRHCEMDPVSQSIACEYLTTRGQKIVGWYHSHPTFPPSPSITDIKTQLSQQAMFTSHGSVFLGLILSPYNKHRLKTQINVVYISEEMDSSTGLEIPYSLNHHINRCPPDPTTEAYSEIIRILTETVEESIREANISADCRLPQLLDPVIQGSEITHLDKLMTSLSSFIASDKQSDVANATLTVTAPFDSVSHLADIGNEASLFSLVDDGTLSLDQGLSSLPDKDSYLDNSLATGVTHHTVGRTQPDGVWGNILNQIRTLLVRSNQQVLGDL